jgi:hypothetical protein
MSNGSNPKNGTMKGTQPKESHSRGLTNGLGNGHTNGRAGGMTNGIGKTNGMAEGGRTNGLTNGLNSDNGSTSQAQLSQRKKQSSSRKNLSMILIIILVATLLGSFIVLLPPSAQGKLVDIDGKFSDWDSKILYQDTNTAFDASLDIVNFSVATEKEVVYGYLHTRGNLQNKDSIERYMLFIDSDKTDSTGYMVDDIGADYVIEAYGWRNSSWTVQTSRFSGTDQRNWSAFSTIGTGAGQSSGDELEFAANVRTTIIPGNYHARFVTASENANGEMCTPKVDGLNGALVITQTPQDNSGIVSANNLVSLTLSASGKDVYIHELHVAGSGVPKSMISNLGMDMLIREGTSAPLTIIADMSNVNAGTLVKTFVSKVTTDGTVSIAGRDLVAYAHGAPAKIAIDGAFADWGGISKIQETGLPRPNSDIDITEHAATAQNNNLFVYVGFSAAGQAFGGAVSPVTRAVTRSGSSGENTTGTETPTTPTLLRRVTGEDVTRVYIDSVANHGALVGGINADFYMEIKGRGGNIVSRHLYTYPEMSLVCDTNVLAESGAHQLEASVPNSLIGSSGGNILIHIETTDWAYISDYTTVRSATLPTVSGTRANPLPVNLGTAANFAVLACTGVTNTGTSMINGNLGVSPAGAISGFPPGIAHGTIHLNDGAASLAQTDLTAAYNDAAGRTPVTIATELGGTSPVPGVYNTASGTFGITGTLTLNGDANAIWIFQAASTLDAATSSQVVLSGGAQASNVFWTVGSSATILGAGSNFKGSILAQTSITVNGGAILEGRALAQTGAITLDTNKVAIPQNTLVINEVMFDNATNPDWFEIHNPTTADYDISGWKLIDGTDLAIYTYPASTNLIAGGYSKIDVGSSLLTTDYLALEDANGTIRDFVTWGTLDPSGTYYQLAVDSFNWPTGAGQYVDTAGYVQGNTLGRDMYSTDTGTAADWDITCGIDATSPTPGVQNIPEFQMVVVPALFLLMISMLAISRRRRMPL